MKLLPVVFACVVIAGCASSGTQVKESTLTQFKAGVTTEIDVIKALGPPQTNMSNSDGTKSIMYVYAHSQVKGQSFIPVVGLFAGGATAQSNVVTFDFDQSGILKAYRSSANTTDVNTGIVGGNSSTPPAQAH
jgi:hypothetical protein